MVWNFAFKHFGYATAAERAQIQTWGNGHKTNFVKSEIPAATASLVKILNDFLSLRLAA
ncbi:hypothetical protein [Olivibacter sp. SDN3]|uniref:hypothetical protein n=1 Tax=Olivibacter sp. SDN3 TaxID=2764720 RepID=UPI001C9E7E6D|nr:hypothetical protein [Olivibacter sp. SDN3]